MQRAGRRAGGNSSWRSPHADQPHSCTSGAPAQRSEGQPRKLGAAHLSPFADTLDMWAPALLALLLIARAAGADAKQLHAEPYSASWNASVTIDLSARSPISGVLWGIFFEEVGLPRRPRAAQEARESAADSPGLPLPLPLSAATAARPLDTRLPPLIPPYPDRARRRWRPLRRAGPRPLVRRARRRHRLPGGAARRAAAAPRPARPRPPLPPAHGAAALAGGCVVGLD